MRFYRALLRLYPRGFREEYGEELCEVFARRTAGSAGPLWRVRTAAAAVADVLPSAAAVHWDVLRQDLRYTGRSLRRSPGFTITALLVVALGVGANTAAFSLADFVLFRPLPFPDSERLVKVWERPPGGGRMEASPANYRDWKETAQSFSALAAYTYRATNLVGPAEPRRLETVQVTPEFFGVLSVPALVGRNITPADSAEGGVMVLSHALWRTQFGGDRDILGKVLLLDGTPHTVIGVMPRSFHFPARQVEAWTPLLFEASDFEDRTNTYLELIGRIRPGATVEGAAREMELLAERMEQAFPEDLRGVGASVYRLRDEISQRARVLVLALCGAALCVLLLACANLASLLLVRATHRARELAVRAALGAGRERLGRQLVTESLVLAAGGGLLGACVALLGLPLLGRLVPATLPVAEQPSADPRVLLVAVAFTGLTSLLFGVAPALWAGRASAMQALRDGPRTTGGRTRRLRAGLVTLEIASSVVLLVSSGLLIRAVSRLQQLDPGFRAEGVLTLRTALPMPAYEATARRAQFYEQVLAQVRALPGVRSAGYATGLPMRLRGGIWPAAMPGEPERTDGSNDVSLRFVTPQYFAAMGIPLRRGRDIAETDDNDRPGVAVVSESFARRHWPGEDPIGKRFSIAFRERTVVGMVGDVRVRGLEVESEPQVYLSYQQVPDGGLISYPPKELVVHAGTAPESLLPAIRRIIRSVDPAQPISDVRTMESILTEETAPRRTQIRLLVLLSAMALLIAGVGVHGLLGFTISHRTPELALRRALGAPAGSVVRLVLAEALALAAAGVALGIAVAYPAARAMSALLTGIHPGDPLTLMVAVGVCLATAVAGALGPALRAMRVDPMTALRAS